MESSQPTNPATRTGLLPVLSPPSRGFFSSNLSLPPVPLAGARRRCRGFGAAPPSSLVRGRRCPDPVMADLFHTFRRPPDLPPCCSRPRPPSHAMVPPPGPSHALPPWIGSGRSGTSASPPVLCCFPPPCPDPPPSRPGVTRQVCRPARLAASLVRETTSTWLVNAPIVDPLPDLTPVMVTSARREPASPRPNATSSFHSASGPSHHRPASRPDVGTDNVVW
ncbi:WAS/WASL-interacting protein family member 3-like [Triticum urartu]|uniref:WAS/WASL-interacting protein family member 3-like n=1 Tax=Triticum urartu TaxID=4572 RepID=UPI0020431F6A|nr:WAS/WASL-interacting protein family member 3-like [Triticum urartu]